MRFVQLIFGSNKLFLIFMYPKPKELFRFCETLPAFQTLATLVFRAIKLLKKSENL
jgi:hypothetical protein